MSDIKLPDLHETVLDTETLSAYFDDLASHAEVFDVIAKGAPQQYAGEQALDLAGGRALIESGLTRGLQVRYRFQGAEWWDTMICQADGVRLVRIEQHFD